MAAENAQIEDGDTVAIWGCGYWLNAVQAMVNVGRIPLAESLGFALPETLDQERVLWQLRLTSSTRRFGRNSHLL